MLEKRMLENFQKKFHKSTGKSLKENDTLKPNDDIISNLYTFADSTKILYGFFSKSDNSNFKQF